jgi:hypothetical protein
VTAVEDMKGSSEGCRRRQSMARQRPREAARGVRNANADKSLG